MPCGFAFLVAIALTGLLSFILLKFVLQRFGRAHALVLGLVLLWLVYKYYNAVN